MGRRSGRTAAKRAAVALGNTPRTFEDDDEPMADAPVFEPVPAPEPEPEQEPEPEAEDLNDAEEEEMADEAADDAAEDAANDDDDVDDDNEDDDGDRTKAPTPPPQPAARRKRLGRPPKNRLSDWDQTAATPERDVADTPRRGRGRGGWRGRGGRRGGPALSRIDQIVDKDGNTAAIADDELLLPEDPEGENKVDRFGNLRDGREYRCRTFTVLGRGARLYMLSTEPARCVGFRDSYLFFTKHMRLYKCIVDDDEKRDMIERDIIPHSYKGRSIAVVTARSVFREFGARIVVGGRRIVDDYEVAAARAEGVAEGSIADPSDHFVPGEPYNKNQYVAWHGASSVYHTSNMPAPAPTGKPEQKKRRVNVNDINWMLEHAKSASAFNTWLTDARLRNLKGAYDIHTNLVHFPASTQPTHAIFEQVPPSSGRDRAGDRNRESGSGGSANNTAAAASSSSSSSSPTTVRIFSPLPPKMARSYLVMDTYFHSPQGGSVAATTLEDADAAPRDDFLTSFRGLGAVPDDIRDLLPPECRAAFDETVARETGWKAGWREMEARQQRERARPIIDKAVMPTPVSQQTR